MAIKLSQGGGGKNGHISNFEEEDHLLLANFVMVENFDCLCYHVFFSNVVMIVMIAMIANFVFLADQIFLQR